MWTYPWGSAGIGIAASDQTHEFLWHRFILTMAISLALYCHSTTNLGVGLRSGKVTDSDVVVGHDSLTHNRWQSFREWCGADAGMVPY